MKKRIRVLYFYPYLQFDTGSPKALVQFIDGLDREVFEPVFCAIGEGPLVEAFRRRNIEIVSRGPDHMLSMRQPVNMINALREQSALLRQHRIDIVHVMGVFWNTDLTLAAAMLRIPVVLHAQNPESLEFQNLNRFAVRKLLFCSHAAQKTFGHLERAASKIEVVHNVIDTREFEAGQSIRSQLGLEDGQIAIGTVAQVKHRKGIDIFIGAARLLLARRKDLVFLIAGPSASEELDYFDQMRLLAASPDLEGRIRFLGSRKDVPNILATLDLFLFPTRAEPFGLVVAEAMAAGAPVVASRVGGIPEIINTPAIGRLVDRLEPEDFAAAAWETLEMPDRGAAMAAQARDSVRKRFDISVGGERLKAIYLELLNDVR